jgi:hypothetical protein
MPEEVFGALEDAFFAAGDAAAECAVADVDLFLDLDPSPAEPSDIVAAARTWVASSLRSAARFCLWRGRLLHFRVTVALSVRADNRLHEVFVRAFRPVAAHRARWVPRASKVILLSVLVSYPAALIAAAAGVI